jgi:spore germination cell wall hydrolase CwlJ-like protein
MVWIVVVIGIEAFAEDSASETLDVTIILKEETEVTTVSRAIELVEEIVVTQKEVTHEEISEDIPEYVIEVTEEDVNYLLQATFAEVGQTGNNLDALAVAATIINRVQDGNYGGDTIVDVLTAENQFATYGNGSFWFSDYSSATEYEYREVRGSDVTAEVKDAVERALLGEDPTDGALFFYAPRWCSEKQEEFFLSLELLLETETTKYLG